MPPKYRNNDANNLPGDVVIINGEMNIMHPIPQTDNYHEDDDYTGHMVKETCNANINSHENPDVNDDSARGLTVSN